MSKSVLLIGAGLTNAFIANNVKNCPKLSKLLDLYVFEKASKIGGRFQTTTIHNTKTDFGAQYVTHTKGEEWSEPYFTDLLEAELITKAQMKIVPGYRVDEKKRNFTFNQGARSIVEHFYKKADMEVKLNHQVLGLTIPNNRKIFVSYEESNGTRERHNGWFDALVSTIPVPEFLESGIVHQESSIAFPLGTKQNLSNTEFTSRYALALYFDQPIELKDGEMNFNFIRKSTNPIVYWTLKPGPYTTTSSIVLHTTVSFGKEYRNHNLKKVENILVEKALQEIKSIGNKVPVHVKCYFWKHSQVHIPYIGSPGFVELHKSPPLILAGDGFSYSGLEGCIESAQKTTDHLRKLFVK